MLLLIGALVIGAIGAIVADAIVQYAGEEQG